MEIKTETYRIFYDPSTTTIHLQGGLRLTGETDSEAVFLLLTGVADSHPEQLVVDIRNLDFINSAGINVLSRFVVRLRNTDKTLLKFLGMQERPWQEKMLKNLQRFKRSLVLTLE